MIQDSRFKIRDSRFEIEDSLFLIQSLLDEVQKQPVNTFWPYYLFTAHNLLLLTSHFSLLTLICITLASIVTVTLQQGRERKALRPGKTRSEEYEWIARKSS
ncbi:hypothetical protein EG350_01810 [Chryseobacterium shandongense]|nr:hypothetical protein EG350_01810 [Chryseobacterium shandongense]